MIEQFFASKRPKPKYVSTHYPVQQQGGGYYSPIEYQQARTRGITPMEYRRRDNLVTKCANECPFQVGDKGYPIDAKKYEKYGVCTILYVTRTYKDMGVDDEWPKSDNPFIIGFRPSVGKGDTILCTNNFLSKENRHMKVEA